MSLQDGLFAEEVENDITLFSKDARRKRVLVFPPVNNYRRFIIHRLVQDRFSSLLKTFSIGQGAARRTVVCYQSDILSNPKLNGVPTRRCVELTDSLPLDKSRGAMGVEESRRSPEDPTSPEHSRMRQVRMSPAVEIYRPPAARRASKDVQSSSGLPIPNESPSSSAKSNRQRRPDRAVYVPKHRRSTETDDSLVPQLSDEIISPSCRSRCNRATSNSPCHENDQIRKQISPHDHDRNESASNVGSSEKRISSTSASSPELCDIIDERMSPREYVENPSEIESLGKIQRTSESSFTSDYSNSRENPEETFEPANNRRDSDEPLTRSSSSSSASSDDDARNNDGYEPSEDSPKSNDSGRNSDTESDRVSSEPTNDETKKSELRESHQRDEETNNKNLRTSSSRNVSNVLIISETKERERRVKVANADKENSTVTPVVPTEKKTKKVARVKSKPAPPPSPPIKLNRDECDWDSLFDDNGECLDPTLIEELTAAVGEVTVEQPKNDYKAFSRPVEISSDEFAHVIEIYNFPSDFKTCDLATVFSPWKNGGFELKWVDDTHCLGVFSSPLVAAEVLGSDHPFVKTRPLSAATSLSKTKARKSVEFLQPYKSRPQTCAALARRLVTGALGVKLATARQEREQEKLVLREAKEKRRLANKQREDVWEGIITEK